MRVNKIELLKEESFRNYTLKRGKSEPTELSVSIKVKEVDSRPWANEVDAVVEAKRTGSGTVVFSCNASYSVEFDEEVAKETPESAKAVWPFIRNEIVSQLGKFHVNLNSMLPFDLE